MSRPAFLWTVTLAAVLSAAVLFVPFDAWAQSLPSLLGGAPSMTDDPGVKTKNFLMSLVRVIAITVSAFAALTLAFVIAMMAGGKLVPPLAVKALAALIAISSLMWIVDLAMNA